jgi:hypothetical protein
MDDRRPAARDALQQRFQALATQLRQNHTQWQEAVRGHDRPRQAALIGREGALLAAVPNLAIVVFTNLGSEACLICKPQLRPVTTPKYCEAVSRNPINKAFTYNNLPRFHTVDLSPQFRKGNFDAVCTSTRALPFVTILCHLRRYQKGDTSRAEGRR